MMNLNKLGISLALIAMLFSSYSVAENSEPLLNFKFNHLSNMTNGEHVSHLQSPTSNRSLEYQQLDATWTYPWETKSINVDLGVTLRHLSGFKNTTQTEGNNHFQEVLPLFHASALFAFPVKGLSAGIEGRHLGTRDRQVFDYRAKVSYEWREGFGLQGGWQHQQFKLENASDPATGFEQTGPFIDFYFNF